MNRNIFFLDFRRSSQQSLSWDTESQESNSAYEINERAYDDQLTVLDVQKKENTELRQQLQSAKLQILKLLSSETQISSISISQQELELENTALKLKLAETALSKERDAGAIKSNFSEMEAKYKKALIDLGKESEEKIAFIISLQDLEVDLKKGLSEREEENIILRNQVSNLHSTFQKQSQTISNTQAQSETKWLSHFEKQNASISNLQEQVKFDGEKLYRMKEEMNRALGQNENLRKTCQMYETKLKDCENEVKSANERTERELSNMRIRHKEKYGQSLKSITDENTKLRTQHKWIENDYKRSQNAVEKLENELERTKALKAVGDQPHLFDTLYDKIRECVTELQTIFCYLQSIGGNESDSFLNISQDYSLSLGHVNPEDRIKQLSKIQTRMKECHDYLEKKYISNLTQDCTLQ